MDRVCEPRLLEAAVWGRVSEAICLRHSKNPWPTMTSSSVLDFLSQCDPWGQEGCVRA